jgi:hypothetical protein
VQNYVATAWFTIALKQRYWSNIWYSQISAWGRSVQFRWLF